MRTPRSCLILGSGVGGLSLGALLARAGVAVTVLEAHPELIGGCAHTLSVDGYKFTAGPRYLWNFGPGQIGHRFLKKCELLERVPMVELDRRGFDRIHVGDQEPVRVPNGWAEYEDVLKSRFPAEATGVRKFFSRCRTAFEVLEILDDRGFMAESNRRVIWEGLRLRPRATAWVLWHRHLTLKEVFDDCRLSPLPRTVLYGHGGIFAEPAETVSFLAYAGGTLLYHRGCYYPVNDMGGFVGGLVEVIRSRGGRVLTDRRVTSVTIGRAGVERVTTQSGEAWTADAVVVNFDPRTFLTLAGRPSGVRVPPYRYSRSVSSLFLGVTDAEVLRPTFGNWNVWHFADDDLTPGLYDADPRDPPKMLCLHSPTLLKGVNNDAPPGHATLTVFAPCAYHALKNADPSTRSAMRERHTELVLDAIEKRVVPGLGRNLGVTHLRTPLDKEQVWLAPEGNIYGRSFGTRDVWARVPFKGEVPNLYFVGAYVGFPGVASVIQAACRVYRELTGDDV